MGTKRLAQSDPSPDSIDSSLRSKRAIPIPSLDVHRAESSRQNLMAMPPTIDARRAQSACQHVKALNAQFASETIEVGLVTMKSLALTERVLRVCWVQSQFQNHPDELWQDGVQDYLNHASHIMETFRDVVDWLKGNAEKVKSASIEACTSEKNSVAEAKNKEENLQSNDKSCLTHEVSAVPFASSWSSGSFSSSQTSIKSGSLPLIKQQAAEDLDVEDDLEQPSSPSLKKTEEQGILVVHEVKCKVYVKPDDPADKGWKDMGMGQLSIKCKEGAGKATKESKPTIIIRNDVGKVLLNALIYPGIKMNIQKSTITTIFHTLGTGNANGGETGNDAVPVARPYLFRLKTKDDTDKLAAAINEYAPAA